MRANFYKMMKMPSFQWINQLFLYFLLFCDYVSMRRNLSHLSHRLTGSESQSLTFSGKNPLFFLLHRKYRGHMLVSVHPIFRSQPILFDFSIHGSARNIKEFCCVCDMSILLDHRFDHSLSFSSSSLGCSNNSGGRSNGVSIFPSILKRDC